jgi:hypothetical protein
MKIYEVFERKNESRIQVITRKLRTVIPFALTYYVLSIIWVMYLYKMNWFDAQIFYEETDV